MLWSSGRALGALGLCLHHALGQGALGLASVLLHAGESVVAVAERLGHQNASLVLSTYGHLMPDSEERTRQAIDAAWSSPAMAEVVGS